MGTLKSDFNFKAACLNVKNDVPNRSLFQLPILLEKLNSKNFKLKVENWKWFLSESGQDVFVSWGKKSVMVHVYI